MIKAFDHAEVYVIDLDKSLEFYTKKLGFKVVRTVEEERIVIVKKGPITLDLYERPKEKAGVQHIAFLVEDVDEAFKELEGIGVEFLHEPTFIPASGRRVASFKDPDGIVLQLAQKLEETPR